MPALKVPVVVTGIEMMRRAIERISIDSEGCQLTSDYVAGFMCFKKCILNVLDELERMREDDHCE